VTFFILTQFVRVIAIPFLGQFWFGRSRQLWTCWCKELYSFLGDVDFWSLFRYQRGGFTELAHRHDV